MTQRKAPGAAAKPTAPKKTATKKPTPPAADPTFGQHVVNGATTLYNKASDAAVKHPVMASALLGLSVAGPAGAVIGALVGTPQGKAAVGEVAANATDAAKDAAVKVAGAARKAALSTAFGAAGVISDLGKKLMDKPTAPAAPKEPSFWDKIKKSL